MLFHACIKAKPKKNLGEAAGITTGFRILCKHYVLQRQDASSGLQTPIKSHSRVPAVLVTTSSHGPCEGRPKIPLLLPNSKGLICKRRLQQRKGERGLGGRKQLQQCRQEAAGKGSRLGLIRRPGQLGACAGAQLTFALRGRPVPDTVYVIGGCTENRGISHQQERSLVPPGGVAPVSDRFPVFKEFFVHSAVHPVSYCWRGQTWYCWGRRGGETVEGGKNKRERT